MGCPWHARTDGAPHRIRWTSGETSQVVLQREGEFWLKVAGEHHLKEDAGAGRPLGSSRAETGPVPVPAHGSGLSQAGMESEEEELDMTGEVMPWIPMGEVVNRSCGSDSVLYGAPVGNARR